MFTKYCIRGRHNVALEFFGDNPRTRDGKQSSCKDCVRVYMQKWRAAKKRRELSKR